MKLVTSLWDVTDIKGGYPHLWAFLLAQWVKNPHRMKETQETRVWSPCPKDPPEEENGNPLHYSCRKSLTDRGTWQTSVRRATGSSTRLSGRAHPHLCTSTGSSPRGWAKPALHPRERCAGQQLSQKTPDSIDSLESAGTSRELLLQEKRFSIYAIIAWWAVIQTRGECGRPLCWGHKRPHLKTDLHTLFTPRKLGASVLIPAWRK